MTSSNPVRGNTTASSLLVGGLRRLLLWGPITAGVGAGIVYMGLFADDPSGWFVLGGLVALAGAIVSLIGALDLLHGAAVLAPLLELSARASLKQEADSSSPASPGEAQPQDSRPSSTNRRRTGYW